MASATVAKTTVSATARRPMLEAAMVVGPTTSRLATHAPWEMAIRAPETTVMMAIRATSVG
jgi:hypothetical protein